jgi:hypothetical protein
MAGTTGLEPAASAVTAVLCPLRELKGNPQPAYRTQIGPNFRQIFSYDISIWYGPLNAPGLEGPIRLARVFLLTT